MTFVVEDGTGVTGATSYCTVNEFKAYADRFGVDITSLSDADIQERLNKASFYVDMHYKFIGERLSEDQGLQYPTTERTDLFFTKLKMAVNYLAANPELWNNEEIDEGVISEQYGSVSRMYRGGSKKRLLVVESLLIDYIVTGKNKVRK